MPITDLCTYLIATLTSSADTIRVPAAAHNEIATALDEPSHLFAEIYTMKYSEQIMIYGAEVVDGITVLNVQRGMGGTTPRSWPNGACLRITQQVDGRPCGPEDGEASQSLLEGLLALLTIGRGLELVDGASGPILRMATTGVTSGTYGGAEVNSTGQFTSIPPGWPASATPAFEVCCEDAGGGVIPDGLVLTVEGVEPDGTGNVRLCANTPDTVPVTPSTPIFICSGGSMAKTTVGQILSLVPDPGTVDLDGYVRSVGGLEPDDTGEVDPQEAALTASLTGATVLLSTAGGLRRTAISNLLAAASTAVTFDMLFNPVNAELELTINGETEVVSLQPVVTASVAGSTLTVSVAGAEASVVLPGLAITNELDLNLTTGRLTSTVNDTEAYIVLPLLSAVPVEGTPPAGALSKLVRTAGGEFYFVPDS